MSNNKAFILGILYGLIFGFMMGVTFVWTYQWEKPISDKDNWAEETYPCTEHVKDWCYDIFQENNEFGVDTKKYNECKQDMVSTFCHDECIIRYGNTEGYCDKPK